jgi:glucose/arabinose dehydrogenase
MRHVALSIVLLAACGRAEKDGTTSAHPDPDAAHCLLDNGGITLSDEFCALVVVDSLGPSRQIAVDREGDVYVRMAEQSSKGSVVALRDGNGDGLADDVERFFGGDGGRGLGLQGDYLYVSTSTEVYRYRLNPGELAPAGEPELIVGGFPDQNSHNSKTFAFDGAGNLYVNVGGPSDACQVQARTRESPGQDPCPQLDRQGGLWQFDAGRPGQMQQADGRHYATGIRHAVAIEWNAHLQALFVVQHGRDSLSDLWPDLFTAEQSSELPAEEMFLVTEGGNFGWPYCYYDGFSGRKVLAPEYGGDGREVGRCADVGQPFAAFPAHWAPNDLIFYDSDYFPSRYRGGAFIAFHGSWNRTPVQEGYRVVFLPVDGAGAAGPPETFADGFVQAETVSFSRDAVYRPVGLATGPAGSLYILDSRKGKIWRILRKPSD